MGQMNFRRKTEKNIKDKNASIEVYSSIVQSLYAEQLTLVVGTISTLLVAVLLYVRSSDVLHLFFALSFSLMGYQRIRDGNKFRARIHKISNSRIRLQFWESQYRIWSSAYVATMGLWFFASMARSSDDLIHLFILSTILAYMVGIPGRNFGSDSVVTHQVLWSGIPIITGLVLFGTEFHMALASFLFPFLIGLRMIAARLKAMLLDAVKNANGYKMIADRFDAALNNILLGIAIIDHEKKFVVVNDRFSKLLGFKSDDLIHAQIDIIGGIQVRQSTGNKVSDLAAKIVSCLETGLEQQFLFNNHDGKTIEVKYHPMRKGGVIVAEDITNRIASENEIRNLASYDPLTHLANRRFFMEEIQRIMLKDGQLIPCSLYFVDLDKFKEINDSLGHPTGDKLLKTIAVRLKSMLDNQSLVCRFGGDEFVILVPELTQHEECSKFAEQIIDQISAPLLLDGHQIEVKGTVGISICPENSSEPDQLLKYADSALYQGKGSGRGMHIFYTDELGQHICDRRQMELDIRKAISKGQFELHYQPLVDIKTNRIVTCEALIRWNHPQQGRISPMQFIPVAEEIGYISTIGEWVLHEACKQCATWPKTTRVAVNISSVQFRQSDIRKVVENALLESGLSAQRLEIEVTESKILDDIENSQEVLKAISDMGVRVVLDDFGTGFSSLSYLQSLPLDKIKIDRSFVANLVNDEKSVLLLEGMTTLSHKLDLEVVIEGIETVEQLDLLVSRIKFDQVQGYLFGRPVPNKDIVSLLGSSLMVDHKKRA